MDHLGCAHPTLETTGLTHWQEKKGMLSRDKKRVSQFLVFCGWFLFMHGTGAVSLLAWNLLSFMHTQKLFFAITYVLPEAEHVTSQNHAPSQRHTQFPHFSKTHQQQTDLI